MQIDVHDLPASARLSHVASCFHSVGWLRILHNLGRAERTIDAYGRGLDQYLSFCEAIGVDPILATLEDVSLFVRWQRGDHPICDVVRRPVSNNTLLQRLTAIRLWYDHLRYTRVREDNPVPRNSYGDPSGLDHRPGGAGRTLVRKVETLPRIPTDAAWHALLCSARSESLRNRMMRELAYFGALRREELVSLEVGDVDFARRLITVRADTTKGGRSRVVSYAGEAGVNLAAYLTERHALDRRPGPLFLSTSNRNRGAPLSKWQWSKTVRTLAYGADMPSFSTHTLRHVRLTHLARANWRIHEIAAYAGHRNPKSTMTYIHLSGTELTSRIARTVGHKDKKIDDLLFG